jgi:hypothetical protein
MPSISQGGAAFGLSDMATTLTVRTPLIDAETRSRSGGSLSYLD